MRRTFQSLKTGVAREVKTSPVLLLCNRARTRTVGAKLSVCAFSQTGIVHDVPRCSDRAAVPWFHAMEHTHYARCIPVNLKDMAEFTIKHPDLARKFSESRFTVQLRQSVFSSITIDQAHEQNDACIKRDGGAVWLTDNCSAPWRWMFSGP